MPLEMPTLFATTVSFKSESMRYNDPVSHHDKLRDNQEVSKE